MKLTVQEILARLNEMHAAAEERGEAGGELFNAVGCLIADIEEVAV